MNSIDTKQTGFGRSSILSDSATKMDNQADNDDNFDVYELVSSDITPTSATLEAYIKSLGSQVLNDMKGTIGNKYGSGDTRGSISKRYKEILKLYNYLRQCLKIEGNRLLLDQTYKAVIDDMYAKNIKYDIALEQLKQSGLVPVTFKKLENCIGYVIYVSKRGEDSSNNFGYIYTKRKNNNKSINVNSMHVVPFKNGLEKSIGFSLNLSVYKLFDVDELTEEKLEGIIKETTKQYLKYKSDIGMKILFQLEDDSIVTIMSLI